jgi:hypothetical protein
LRELQGVYLGGEDKIALREAVNLVRPDGDFGAAPAEADVRVMALLFGQLAHSIDELKGLSKIFERVALEQVMFTRDIPSTEVFQEFLNLITLQRRDSATARHAIAAG